MTTRKTKPPATRKKAEPKKPTVRGRRPKLEVNPDIAKKVEQAVRAGNYFQTACRYAGIAPHTGYKWLAWGEGRDYPDAPCPPDNACYRDFRDAVTRANAASETELAALLKSAAPHDWRAAEAMLKRRFPDRWGTEHQKVEHSGTVTVAQDVGRLMGVALRGILADLDLTPAQVERAPDIVKRHLLRFEATDDTGSL